MRDYKRSARAYHSCGSKTRYKDEHAARQAVKRCRENFDKEYDFYYCGRCKGYHLTSYREYTEIEG